MTQDTLQRVWRPTRRVLAACLAISAGYTAVAVNLLLASDADSRRPLVWLILVVAVAPLVVTFSKVVLTADSVVVRNLFAVHRVLLSQIRGVTNYSRGSVRIKTVNGQTIQVYAVNTPMLAVISGRRSRANDFMEAVEAAALARGAPIDRTPLRRALGASTQRSSGAPAPPITQAASSGQPATPHRGGGAHRRPGRTGEAPFPRRKLR